MSDQAGRPCGGAGAANAAPSAAGGGNNYLETDRNAVTSSPGDLIPLTGPDASRIVAVRCGCRSWFCPGCCLSKGLTLKERLIPVLASFRRIVMLTLTVDPRHFAGPREAFAHVKAARCLSVTVQALRRAGVMRDKDHPTGADRWFCVVEFHKNGWPHWHVLVESDRIGHDVLCHAWNVNLAKLGKSVEETRVGFGAVKFSAREFAGGAAHAANYACKYLLKTPEQGYPAWVLGSETRKVHRYSTSDKFWRSIPPAAERAEEAADAAEDGREDATDDEASGEDRPRRTIGQQVSACGRATVILRETDWIEPASGEIVRRCQPLATVAEPLADLLARVGCVEVNERGTRAVLRPGVSWGPAADRSDATLDTA